MTALECFKSADLSPGTKLSLCDGIRFEGFGVSGETLGAWLSLESRAHRALSSDRAEG